VFIVAVVLAGLFGGPAVASAATNIKVIAFSGHYTGTAALLINNGSATITSVRGKGTGTLLGASTVLGAGSAAASAQCDPFNGTGSISGAAGRIELSVTRSTSQGCSSGQSGPVTVTFKGVTKATGGSGKADGATGTLKFNGSLKLAKDQRFPKVARSRSL
jgi:hypothetical protein